MSDNKKWHPQPAVHVGSSDARHDYLEVWKFPCCQHIMFSDTSPAQECEDGCQTK